MNLPALHPALIHFPIGLYFFEMILLMLWLVKKDSQYKHVALICFKVAYVAMWLALVSGLIDVQGFAGITDEIRPHFFAALCVAVLQTFRALHWRFRGDKETIRDASISLSYAVAAYTLVLVTMVNY